MRTGGHAFLEYIDPVAKRWAISDPTNYIFAVRDRDGLPLSAVELNRVLSLPADIGSETLVFDIVNPINWNITAKSFNQLPVDVQRDLRFYFRPMNSLTYHSGKSSIYTKRLEDKIYDWLRLDRRFIFSLNYPSISSVLIRIASFWFFTFGLLILVLGELVWRSALHSRKEI